MKARSSSGKSWLVNRVLDLFRPIGVVIEFSRITPAYLENMASKNRAPKPLPEKNESDSDYLDRVEKWKNQARTIDLKGKILFIDELRGIQNAQAPKLIISEGRLRLGTVDVNRQSVELEVTGTPTIVTTTTQAALEDPEFENRVLSIEVDESEDQTKRIIERHAERFADPAEDLSEYQREKAIVEFFNNLRPYKVANPFSTLIGKDYPTKNVEARRDFPKLFGLANSLTWLNQKKRRKAKKGLELFLVTDLADIEKIREIGLSSLRESLAGYSEKEDALLEVFKNEVDPSDGTLEESNASYRWLTVSQAANKLRSKVRRGEEWTRKHIAKLVEEEFLEEHPDNIKGKKGLRYRYAELQPEVLEIDTSKYGNEILSAWAESYGYQLLPESTETEQRLGVQRGGTELSPKQIPFEQSEPKNPPNAAFGESSFRTEQIGGPKPVNSVVPRFTPDSSHVEKKLCRRCLNKKYLTLYYHAVSIDPTGPCEDCGDPSEIQIRIRK